MTFTDKQKLEEFNASRPALQEIQKGVIQVEMNGHSKVVLIHLKNKQHH